MERHPQSAVSQVNTLIQKKSYRVIESNNNFFFLYFKADCTTKSLYTGWKFISEILRSS